MSNIEQMRRAADDWREHCRKFLGRISDELELNCYRAIGCSEETIHSIHMQQLVRRNPDLDWDRYEARVAEKK